MANFIPRLEWNDISIVGDTATGNATITSVVSTASVIEGMIISHAAFPADSYVISKTVNSVTINNNATANNTADTLNLFQRLDFSYPSYKQVEPTYLPTESINESLSGFRQVQINNVIKKVELELRFVTSIIKQDYETKFYKAWAMYGKEFRYYESKDVASYENFSLDDLDFKPVRSIPKAGNFLYNIPLKLRRIYL